MAFDSGAGAHSGGAVATLAPALRASLGKRVADEALSPLLPPPQAPPAKYEGGAVDSWYGAAATQPAVGCDKRATAKVPRLSTVNGETVPTSLLPAPYAATALEAAPPSCAACATAVTALRGAGETIARLETELAAARAAADQMARGARATGERKLLDEARMDMLRDAVAVKRELLEDATAAVAVAQSEAARSAAALEDSRRCVVCMAAPRAALFLPCSHLACCAGCHAAMVAEQAAKLGREQRALGIPPQLPGCPICREPVRDVVPDVRCP